MKILHATLVFALFLLPADSAYADDGQCHPLTEPAPKERQQPLSPPKTKLPSLSTDKIDIFSETADVSLNDTAVLNNVEIHQGDSTLKADVAHYNLKTQAARVEGNVQYEDPQVRLRGDSGDYDPEHGSTFKNAHFELPFKFIRGQAAEMSMTPDEKHFPLKDVQYTSCPVNAQDWVLKASNINLDDDTHSGTGKGVVLDFKGVPILYTPFISFPLDNERKSGFLFPNFGTSTRSGIELSTPYYFNLAPNYDLLLTPTEYSRRGLDLSPDFRYLTEEQKGELLIHFLPGDNQRDSDRSLIQWKHRTDFANDWRLTVDATGASDQYYFEDFGLGPEDASVTYLNRNLMLEHFGAHWNLLAQVRNFQTIDQTIPDYARPYSELPRLVGDGRWDDLRGGFSFHIDDELVYFYRSDARLENLPNGARLDVSPELSWTFNRPGLYLTPALAYRETRYRLDDAPLGLPTEPSRGAPIGSLDAGMTFERPQGSAGQRTQTLEPRLLYLYVPYRNQDNLPIFDTDLPDLNLVELFRQNRYMGADRLGDANQLSTGITSRLLDNESGRQYMSATIGQTYYFTPPKVTLPGEVQSSPQTSDLISELSLTAYRNWNVNLGNEWNPMEHRSEKAEVTLQYKPSPYEVANLSYRFRRGLIEQVDSSVAWPIAGKWNVYARGVYSLLEGSMIDEFAGFEYGSCCWRLRLVERRYISSRTGQRESSVGLQLELNGLSSVGKPVDTFLQNSIRGYSRRDEDLTPFGH